jgi:hypothetical protein
MSHQDKAALFEQLYIQYSDEETPSLSRQVKDALYERLMGEYGGNKEEALEAWYNEMVEKTYPQTGWEEDTPKNAAARLSQRRAFADWFNNSMAALGERFSRSGEKLAPGTKEAIENYSKDAAGPYDPKGYVPGKGIKTLGGGYTSGDSGFGAGGQRLAFTTKRTKEDGDVRVEGALSVNRAQPTLRPTYQQAGKDVVHQMNNSLQSDILFETFNYTPIPNQELGLDNPLSELNTQHEFLRFNPTNELFQPRAYMHKDMPHMGPMEWEETKDLPAIAGDFAYIISRQKGKDAAADSLEKNPVSVFEDEAPQPHVAVRMSRVLRPDVYHSKIQVGSIPSKPCLEPATMEAPMRDRLHMTWVR